MKRPQGFLDCEQGLRLMQVFQGAEVGVVAQAIALTRLALAERLDMTTLAEACGISCAGALGTVNALLKRGLVQRGPIFGEDRRKVFVWLTPEGTDLVERAYAEILAEGGAA